MSIFENFEKKLQAEPKSIVFTEGTDARILSAASRLLAGKTLKVILLGELEAVKKAAADGSFDITGAEIIDPANYEGMDEMVAKMVELRKGKMTDEQCRAGSVQGQLLRHHAGEAWARPTALLGGATYSTADTVRPGSAADQDQARHHQSCQLLHSDALTATGEDEHRPWATAPSTSIPPRTSWWRSAVETAHTAPEIFGIDPKVAFLSYSTKGSGKGEDRRQDAQRRRRRPRLATPN